MALLLLEIWKHNVYKSLFKASEHMSHVIHVQKRSQKSGNWGICKSDCTRGTGGQRRHLAQVVKV